MAEDLKSTLSTLGDIAASGHTINIDCNTCRHGAALDAKLFVDTLGADFRFNGLKARQTHKPLVRCTNCNGSSVHFQIGSPT